ncbi:MAG TPA: hypothetical protein VF664_04210, partial [Cystobacter sp.]
MNKTFRFKNWQTLVTRFLAVPTAAALLAAGCGGHPGDLEESPGSLGQVASSVADPTVPIASDLNAGSQNQLGEISGL